MTGNASRVFISYSHDSVEHQARVRELADTLRSEGLDIHLDQDVASPSQGWRAWMEQQIEDADFVLVVCSAGYREKASLRGPATSGHGAIWESALLLRGLYEAGMWNERLIPVLLGEATRDDILPALKDYTSYRADEPGDFQALCRQLRDPAPAERRPGALPRVSRALGQRPHDPLLRLIALLAVPLAVVGILVGVLEIPTKVEAFLRSLRGPDVSGRIEELQRELHSGRPELRLDSADYFQTLALDTCPSPEEDEELARLIAEIRKVLEIAPDDVDGQLLLAAAFSRSESAQARQQAGALLDRLVDANPRHGKARFDLCSHLSKEGKLEEALTHCEEAVALIPGSLPPAWQRAKILTTLGRVSEALRELDRLIAQEPELPLLYHDKATALVAMGRNEDALAVVERGRAVAGASAILETVGVLAHLNLEAPDRALQGVERVLAVEPDLPHALMLQGLALATLGREEEAEASYRQAIEAGPCAPLSYANLGVLLVGQGRNDEAIRTLEQGAARAPGSAALHHNLGASYAVEGRFTEAVTHFRRAFELDPKAGLTCNSLERALRFGGEVYEALKVAARCTGLVPRTAGAGLHRQLWGAPRPPASSEGPGEAHMGGEK